MKPREYIKMFGDSPEAKETQEKFMSLIAKDFDDLLILNKGQTSLDGFERSIHDLRVKWEAIGHKRSGPALREDLWKALFDKKIKPMRDAIYGATERVLYEAPLPE
jgi:hypothetical protein